MISVLAIAFGLSVSAPGSGYGDGDTPFMAVLAAAADSASDGSLDIRPGAGAFRGLPRPQHSLHFEAQRIGAVDAYRFRVRVRALAGRRVVASQDYNFPWRAPEQVLVPVRRIARGEAIEPADVRRVPRDGARGDFARELGDIIGRSARRALIPGRPFLLRDLKAATLIKRGSAVLVRVRQAGLTVTLKAQAMESKGRGEPIRLLNPASRKTLVATVVDKDVAEIRL